MATERISATVDAEVMRELRARVGRRGLSSFVSRAIRHELDRVALRELLEDLAAELGPADERMVAEADKALDALASVPRRRHRDRTR